MKQKLLLSKLMLLLLVLVGGVSTAWAQTTETVFLETFGSIASTPEFSSYDGYSASKNMFTTIGDVKTHYSGSGKVGKNNYAAENLSSGYTDASGLSGCYQGGTANTQKTIIQISDIKIRGYENLSLSFGALGGSTSHKVDVSYKIDNGEETSLISNGSITNAHWTLLTADISGTGESLTLIFKHTPTKNWTIRMDDIKVTGTAVSSGDETQSAKPEITGEQGVSFTLNQLVSISATEGASIYYTTNGDDPEEGVSQLYTSPFQISATTTVKAIAVESGKTASKITEVTFTKTLATPNFAFATPSLTLKVGQTFTLDASSSDSDGAISYRSGSAAVATTSAGVLTAVGEGTTTITATLAETADYAKATATCNVTVISTTPTSTAFSESFESSLGDFTVSGDEVWQYRNQDKCAYANVGSKEKTNSWLVSPVFDLSDYENTKLTFEERGGYFTGEASLKLYAKKVDDTDWTDISGDTFSNLTTSFSDATVDLSAYDGKKIQIAFEYVSTTNNYGNIRIKNLKVKGIGHTNITISSVCTDGNDNYYGTFYTNHNYVMNDDIEGMVVSVEADGVLSVQTAYHAGEIVPANTALLIYSLAGGSYPVYYIDEEGDDYSEFNMLKGTLTADEMTVGDDCLFYRLTMHNGTKIGFWWGADDGGAFKPGANKAYLAVPNSVQGARISGFSFDADNTTTAIENVSRKSATSDRCYNLNGQRVDANMKGIVIVNGKKMINK